MEEPLGYSRNHFRPSSRPAPPKFPRGHSRTAVLPYQCARSHSFPFCGRISRHPFRSPLTVSCNQSHHRHRQAAADPLDPGTTPGDALQPGHLSRWLLRRRLDPWELSFASGKRPTGRTQLGNRHQQRRPNNLMSYPHLLDSRSVGARPVVFQ